MFEHLKRPMATAGAILSLAGIGLSGCAVRQEEVNRKFASGNAAASLEIKRHAPDWHAELQLENSPSAARHRTLQASTDKRLARGREVLLLVKKLLSMSLAIEDPNGGEYVSGPFLYIGDSYDALGDQWPETVTENPDFRELKRAMPLVRVASATELRELRVFIIGLARQEGSHASPEMAILYTSLPTKLDILAERIEKKQLLVDENILNYRHKTGDTSLLLGRTEYLNEAISELDQLIRLRKASGVSDER